MRIKLGLIFIIFFFTLVSPASAQTKRIYIANDDHTDYMWTANEAAYRTAFRDMISYYLDQANSTAGYASPYQSRFNLDGTLWLWFYQQDVPSRFPELISRIKDGHISVPSNTFATVFGGQPSEAILRGMYFAGRLERQYQITFPITVAMENQTLPFGLGSLWAGAGTRYSWRGICNCASALSSAGDREKEIYWWTGLDNSRILMKWNSMLTNDSQGIGGYAEARSPASIVNYVDTNSTFKSRYPYNVIGAFGKGWDDLSTRTTEFVTAAQQSTSLPARQVYVSNETDFFQDFETTYGANLTSQSVSFGNEWDLFSATVSEYSARVRRSVEKLRTAESLAAMVSLVQPDFMTAYTTARNQALINLALFWEHCGGSGGSVGQTARLTWMKQMVSSFETYVNTLQADAITALSARIDSRGANPRFLVFNPLTWVRTDVADLSYSGSTPVHVLDIATGQEVPSQIITLNSVKYLRIIAANLPSLGYKTYEIVPGTGSAFPSVVTASGSLLENQRYKVTVGSQGAITSLLDKTMSNREFAKTINSKALNDLGAATGTLAIENAGPVSATLVATATSPVAHTSRITLYRDVNRIDIDNLITQNFTTLQTWTFAFNLTNPDTYHEELGAVIRAKLASAGGQYSGRSGNTRYDWLTLNHFVDMTGSENYGLTLSNWDLDFMKLGNSTVSSLDTTTPMVAPVAGGDLNSGEAYSGQGGATSFRQRFALQTHTTYNQTAAMKMALEHQNPLIAAMVTSTTPSYPETSYSLLSISDPDVLGWAVKPHEDGIAQGLVVRVWNQTNNPKSFTATMGGRNVTTANQVTHIETDVVNGYQTVTGGAMQASVEKQQLKTFRLVSSINTNQPTNTPAPPPVSPTPTPIPGDLDLNGHVDILDIQYLLSRFSQYTIYTYNLVIKNFGL